MKILLCCLAGVTSTLFSSKLKDAASRKRVDATVWSASEHAVEYSSNLADVILVEPQLKGSYEKIKADNVHLIGDAKQPTNVMDAIWVAYESAMTI